MGSKRIWREIVFDVELEPASVRLATLFLTVVEDSEVPLHIYARFSSGNLPNPTLDFLLAKLRQHTHRWERFLYWGRLGLYRLYLDLPAPRLQYFSDDHDPSHLHLDNTLFFSGQVPILRSLVTSALRSWQPKSMTNLQTLNLWDCATRLSIKSLLGVLCCTPQLREINIVSPALPILDWPSGEVVDLLHLENLKVYNPGFCKIIGCLTIPNVRTVILSGVDTNGDPELEAFQIPHPLLALASTVTPLPMLGQPVVAAFFSVNHAPLGLRFNISFTTEKRTYLSISLGWANSINIHRRMNYIQHSISILAGMHFLAGALLQFAVCGCSISYNNPLFHLGTIEYLRVEGKNFLSLQKALSCRQVPLLPSLKFLYIPGIRLDKKTIGSLHKFLQFRRGLIMTFDIENHQDLAQKLGKVCVVAGKSVLLEITSPLTD